MKMDDDEDYTFSSTALKSRRRARRLRMKKTGAGAENDADDGANSPSSPTKPGSNGNLVASRIKKFGGGAVTHATKDEAPGAIKSGSSGDTSDHHSNSNSSSYTEEEVHEYEIAGTANQDEVYEYEIEGSANQDESEEVQEYQIAGTANQEDLNASDETEVEYVDENGEPYKSGESYEDDEEDESEYMEVEDGDIPEYRNDEDPLIKYGSYLTRGSKVEKSWKKPAGKLGSAPDISFDDDYNEVTENANEPKTGSMFGGASKFGDTRSYADRAREMIAKMSEDSEDTNINSLASESSSHGQDSPVPDPHGLSSEDMSELKSMLSINSASDEDESSTAKDDYLFGVLMKQEGSSKPSAQAQRKKQQSPYETYTTASKYAMDSSDDEDEIVDVGTTESSLGLGHTSADDDASSQEESFDEESYIEEEEIVEDEEEKERQLQYLKSASKPFNPMGSFSDVKAARKVVAEAPAPESPVPQTPVTTTPVQNSPSSSRGQNDVEDTKDYEPESPRKKSDKTPISILTNAANAQLNYNGDGSSASIGKRKEKDVLASVALSYVGKKKSDDEDEDDLKEFLDNDIEGRRQGSVKSEEEDNFSELWAQSVASELRDVPQTSKASLGSSVASGSFRREETSKKRPKGPKPSKGPQGKRPSGRKPPIEESPSSDSSNTSHSTGREEEKREIQAQHNGGRNSPPEDMEASLRLGDNDNNDDSFSLGASRDIEEDDSERYQRPEYNPRRTKRNNNNEEDLEGSLSIGAMESLQQLEADQDSSSSESSSSDERGRSKQTNPAGIAHDPNLNPKPTICTAIVRHICRAIVTLLILGAILAPLYFLIVEPLNEPTTDDIEPLDLFQPFGRVPGLSPVQPPNPDSGGPSPTPLIPDIPGPPLGTPAPNSFILITPQPTPRPSLRATSPPATAPVLPPPNGGGDIPLEDLLISVWPGLEAALADVTSPQSLAVQWLSRNVDLGSFTNAKKIQRFALATFYYSTEGDSWTRNDGWLSDDDECNWYTSSTNLQPCNETGSFVNLELDLNNLGGTLPAELALLSGSLTQMELSRFGSSSFIGGTIPPEFGSLSLLGFLSLRGNQLSGTLPTELGQMESLDSIDLSENILSGNLPEETGSWSQVSILDMGSNRFSGPLPTSLGRLPRLRSLILSNNQFTGPLPAELGRLFLLEELDLEANGITSIPTEIGSLILLRSVSLAKNKLVGSIPTEVGGLVNLLSLDLGENQLTGTIPSEIGNLFLVRGTFLYFV